MELKEFQELCIENPEQLSNSIKKRIYRRKGRSRVP